MNLKEFHKYIESPRYKEKQLKSNSDCPDCHSTRGVYKTDFGILCDDCYYFRLGNEIEKRPIGNPQYRNSC